MDMNGDLKIDLVGTVPGFEDSFKVWQNVWNNSAASSPVFDVYVAQTLHVHIEQWIESICFAQKRPNDERRAVQACESP